MSRAARNAVRDAKRVMVTWVESERMNAIRVTPAAAIACQLRGRAVTRRTRLTDGVDGEAASPGRTDVDEAAVVAMDGGGIGVVRGAADAVADVLVPAGRPVARCKHRAIFRISSDLPGAELGAKTRQTRVHRLRLVVLTLSSLMTVESEFTVGLPLLKCTRATSSAVMNGREIETRMRRMKAQNKKMTPGMWNARGIASRDRRGGCGGKDERVRADADGLLKVGKLSTARLAAPPNQTQKHAPPRVFAR